MLRLFGAFRESGASKRVHVDVIGFDVDVVVPGMLRTRTQWWCGGLLRVGFWSFAELSSTQALQVYFRADLP